MDCNFSAILHDKWDSLITDLEIKLSSQKEGEILAAYVLEVVIYTYKEKLYTLQDM
jgi:hypothetical protein